MTLMDNPPVTMEDFFEASRGLWLNRRVVDKNVIKND
jgi:hypothetical protein